MSLDVHTFSYLGVPMGDIDDASMQDTMTSMDDVDMANEIDYDSVMDEEDRAPTQHVQELEMTVADHEFTQVSELVDTQIIDVGNDTHDVSFISASHEVVPAPFPVPIIEVEPSNEQLYGEAYYLEAQPLVEEVPHVVEVHALPHLPPDAVTFVEPTSPEIPTAEEIHQQSPVSVVAPVHTEEPQEPEQPQIHSEVNDPTPDDVAQPNLTEHPVEVPHDQSAEPSQDHQNEQAPQPHTLPPAETVEQEDDLNIDTPPAVLLSIAGSSASYSLFALPTTGEIASTSSASLPEPTLLLAGQPTLYYEPISAVFDAIRQQPAFEGHCNNAELVFNFHQLNLKLAEDSKWTSEFTLHRLWLVNMGCEQGILSIQLECITPRFIERVRMIEAEIEKRDAASEAEAAADFYRDAAEDAAGEAAVPATSQVAPTVDEYEGYEEEVEAAAALDRQTLPTDQAETKTRHDEDQTQDKADPEAAALAIYQEDDGNEDDAEGSAVAQTDSSERADLTPTKAGSDTLSAPVKPDANVIVEPAVATDSEPNADTDGDNDKVAAAQTQDDLDDPETWQEDTSTLDDSEGPAVPDQPTSLTTADAREEDDELADDDAEYGSDYDDVEPASTNPKTANSVTDPSEQPDLYVEAQDGDSGESDDSDEAVVPSIEVIPATQTTSKSASPSATVDKQDADAEGEDDDLYNDDAGEETTSGEDEDAEELIDYEEDEDEPGPSKLKAQTSVLSNVSSSSSVKRTFHDYEDGQDAADDDVPSLESKRSRTKY